MPRLPPALVATWPRRLALALAVAGLAGVAWRAVRGREVPAYAVEARPIVQRVVATGRVRPPARVAIGSLVLGRVRAVPAREGDRVATGRLLVKLDDADAQAALRQAEGRVAEAAARLEGVRGVSGRQAAEALRQAEVRVAQAEADAERARALGEAGSGSRQAQEDAERAVRLARSQRDAAEAQALSAARGPDERLAAAALAQADAARAAARARLAETELRAPAAGQVLTREVEPGDVVAAGRTVLTLTLDGPVQLTAQVDEKNLSVLAPGQAASASADAFPERPFPARVAWLSPSVDAARGTVEVRLDVAEPPAFLRADMTVSITVEVARRERALVLAAEAVRGREGPGGAPWVLVVSGGRAERRAVRLGVRGEGLVEIADGLAAGDEVVAPAAGPVSPGERVRARRLPSPAAAPAPGAAAGAGAEAGAAPGAASRTAGRAL